MKPTYRFIINRVDTTRVTERNTQNSTRRNVLKAGGLILASSTIATTAQAQPGNGKGKRNPNERFNLDFSDPSDVDDVTQSSPGWVTDRQAPESFTTTSDGHLRINIDETGPTSGFFGYQGKKYQDAGGEYWLAGNGSTVLSYDFYIDPEWEADDDPQETGMWPVLGNESGGLSAYPILAYQDSTASETGEAQFRTYVYESTTSAEWVNLGIPSQTGIDPEEGGWVNVTAQLHDLDEDDPEGPGSALKWRVNGKLVYDERGYNVYSPSTQFLEFIINSVNFGNDEDYLYDNLVLTEPGTAEN